MTKADIVKSLHQLFVLVCVSEIVAAVYDATFRLEMDLNNPANMQAAEGLPFSGGDSGQAAISRELAEQNQNSR